MWSKVVHIALGTTILLFPTVPAGTLTQGKARAAETGAAGDALQLVMQYGGLSGAIAVKNRFAYVGTGARLVIVDIGNAARPTPVGEITLRGSVRAVELQDDRAYVRIPGHVEILDISDPSHPVRAGSAAIPPRQADDSRPEASSDMDGGIAVAGRLACVSVLTWIDVGYALRVIVADLSTPASPRWLGTYEFLMFDPFFDVDIKDTAAEGSTAFVAFNAGKHGGSDGRVAIIDISDPASPREVSSYSVPAPPDPLYPGYGYNITGLAVSDGYAYVGTPKGGGELHVVDVSDPTTPVKVGSYAAGSVTAVAVDGTQVFVKTGLRRDDPLYGEMRSMVHVLDVTQPENPASSGVVYLPHITDQLAASGGRVCTIAMVGGLQIVDATLPEKPRLAGTWRTSGAAGDLAIAGTHAFIATYGIGETIQVVDIIDPTRPRFVGAAGHGSYYRERDVDLVVTGPHAYFVGGGYDLLVFGTADPARPVEIAEYEANGRVVDVAIKDTHVYVAESNGLSVIDVSDPTEPRTLGRAISPLSSLEAIAVAGSFVYAVTSLGNYAAIAFDVSRPEAPVVAGTWSPPPHTRRVDGGDIAAYGRYVYIASGDFWILDFSTPSNPRLVGRHDFLDPSTEAYAVALAGRYAFVAAGPAGLYVLDISEPTRITEVAHHDLPGFARRVVLHGPYIFVANREGGLAVYRTGLLPTPPPAPRFTSPCGMTNWTSRRIDGIAPAGASVTLYVDGAPVETRWAHGTSFAFAPVLSRGTHLLTATATTPTGTSLPSAPLRLTVEPLMPWDPMGVSLTYPFGEGDMLSRSPVGVGGCIDPTDGWAVVPARGVPTVVSVSAWNATSAVTVTLGSQTRRLSKIADHTFSTEFEPMSEDGWADPEGNGFTIEVVLRGNSTVVPGRVLWRQIYLPRATPP